MIGVFRERFFTFRMKLKMFITSSDHYLKYLAILFLVKASGLGDFVSQNPLFSYGAGKAVYLKQQMYLRNSNVLIATYVSQEQQCIHEP